ncbi:GntR family transcriptional regulator [Aureimonas mangrovi]|uniref:GntR family transcriptional regulator n=1 Tax=Aureimonas mangrovi TaxID=2758041 RepID=UPI001FE9855C|nr:GntR family transcriptional regulator [Aureimonas mangrovi]
MARIAGTGDAALRAVAPRAATLVYRALHADIVSLCLKPGEPLHDRELETRFGVSRTPIREAILRLADEKLVDIFPQSGTFVSRIPVRVLFEAILIRKALEETTVRLALEAGTRERFDVLEANLGALEAAARAQNRPLFHELDTAFHEEISHIAGFPGIWDAIQQVKVQIDRYRLLTLPEEGRLSRVVEEHAAVLAALRQGDADAAVGAMGHHLGQMLGELKDRGRLDPDHFIDDDADGAADRLTVASTRTSSHAH